MGNEAKKKDLTQVNEVFSISFDDMDSAAVPGVTRLINPELLKKKAEAAQAKNGASQTSPQKPAETKVSVAPEVSISFDQSAHTPVFISPAGTTPEEKMNPPTLESLGVLFEIHFESERGYYRFARFKKHLKAVEAWQEQFFSQMKLDLKTLNYAEGFQEYSADQNHWQGDAFGLQDSQFVQIIRALDQSKTIQVLISSHSLLNRKSYLLDFFGEKKKEEDVGAIEIDFG